MGAQGGYLDSADWKGPNTLAFTVSDITTGAGSIEIRNGGAVVGKSTFTADNKGKASGTVSVNGGCNSYLGAIVFDGQLGSPAQIPLPSCLTHVVDVTPATLPQGILQIFAIEPSGDIKTCWKISSDPGAGWSNWQSHPGQARRISAATLPEGVPQLWCVGNSRQLYTMWKVSDQAGASWTGWTPMAGAPYPVTDIAAVKLPQGGLQLFVIKDDNTVHTCWKISSQPGAAWSNWQSHPGLASRITGASLPQDVPQLWCIGKDGQLYTMWKVSDQPDAEWNGWKVMTGAPSPVIDVGAVKLPDGSLQLFVVKSDSTIHTCWKVSTEPGANWTAFQPHPGEALRITGDNLSNNLPQLWCIGSDQRLWTQWKASVQPGAVWTNWIPFGLTSPVT